MAGSGIRPFNGKGVKSVAGVGVTALSFSEDLSFFAGRVRESLASWAN